MYASGLRSSLILHYFHPSHGKRCMWKNLNLFFFIYFLLKQWNLNLLYYSQTCLGEMKTHGPVCHLCRVTYWVIIGTDLPVSSPNHSKPGQNISWESVQKYLKYRTCPCLRSQTALWWWQMAWIHHIFIPFLVSYEIYRCGYSVNTFYQVEGGAFEVYSMCSLTHTLTQWVDVKWH